MKNILKISFFLTVLVLTQLSSASAQSNEKPNTGQTSTMTAEERTEKRTEMLKSKLLLSKDQTDKVRDAIYKQECQRGADKNEMKLSREVFDKEMVAILDPEQLEKYRDLQEQRKEEMKKAQQEKENKVKLENADGDKTN